MSETVKNEKKRDKETSEEVKKPSRIGQAKHVDFAKGLVTLDNIRKEINTRERKLEKIRADKYDYLRGDFIKKILAEECAIAGIPVDTFEAKPPVNLDTLSPIPLKASPMPVPKTSSAIVGWRSSRREHNLEFVGPFYVAPKHTIEPPMIPGEFRVTNQKFIFLG
ncbi:uncharacterized protein [Venturia canescens]|nr:uncharacterized protein LOC122416099 isoform X2 [Venturia canescens]